MTDNDNFKSVKDLAYTETCIRCKEPKSCKPIQSICEQCMHELSWNDVLKCYTNV